MEKGHIDCSSNGMHTKKIERSCERKAWKMLRVLLKHFQNEINKNVEGFISLSRTKYMQLHIFGEEKGKKGKGKGKREKGKGRKEKGKEKKENERKIKRMKKKKK